MLDKIFQLIENYGMKILVILVLFLAGRELLRLVVSRAIKVMERGLKMKLEETTLKKRSQTLKHVLIVTGDVVIYLIVLLMILNLFGVDIRPILAGAGILGLAVGFGAQTLIKDFISGIFILVENQYNVGDKVKIGNFEGKVIKITIRSTVLKDDQGRLYYIPNGSIQNVINLSQGKNKE